MHIDIDTLVLALISVALVWRLWSVLGQRNEEDPQRPNPFTPPPETVQKDESFVPRIAMPAPALPPASLAGGLQQVRTADESFDEKAFLETARGIFTAVIQAYAAGVMEDVAEQIAPALRDHFQQAIDARKTQGQTAETRILSMESEAIAAHIEGTHAYVTVKFTSRQENILRDKQGAVIGGESGKAEEVTDIWTFGRDTATPGAAWLLTATHG